MADREFVSFIPKIQPSVPGCPQPLILQHIRDAAIRACERTLVWRYMIPLFDLTPGEYEYTFNVPSGTKVHAIFEAMVNGNPLQRLTLEQALVKYPEWADLYDTIPFDPVAAKASQPRAITQTTPNEFIVLPLPDDEDTYTVRMFTALKPTKTATGIEETIFDELEDAIMHGALQHLLLIPQVHWSDLNLASYHAKQFVYHLAEARARANLGNVRGSMSVRMQPFA